MPSHNDIHIFHTFFFQNLHLFVLILSKIFLFYIQDYASVANVPVMIISYEMFVRNVEEIKKIKFDLLVCDEGHRLKNVNVKTTMVCNLNKFKYQSIVILFFPQYLN